jgi:putative FmdB family regulatory protein
MPRYDYLCAEGHTHERIVPVGTDTATCPDCGALAPRQSIYQVSVGGFTPVPYDQRPLYVDRALNAMGDIQHDAKRMGVRPPDHFAEAKRQVASGEAEARLIDRH